MLLHQFYGTDKYSNRKSVVFKIDTGFLVYMIQDSAIIEERTLEGHSEQYAEDCAENWVLGIIENDWPIDRADD